jgi:hypothetical protein
MARPAALALVLLAALPFSSAGIVALGGALGVGAASAGATPAGCLTSAGTLVDWWMIVKLPSGTRSLYMDSTSACSITTTRSCWTKLDSVNDATSPLNTTLWQLTRPDMSYGIYNDDPGAPLSYQSSFAHAKVRGTV